MKANRRAADSERVADILFMNTRLRTTLHSATLLLPVLAALFIWPTSALRRPSLNPQAIDVTSMPEQDRGPRGLRRVALTFDAGGEDDMFPALLSALAAENVHSTFFLTGNWMHEHPDHVRFLVSSGHELGNHTWSHRDLTQLDDAKIRAELESTGALLAQQAPAAVSHWWRAPYGARDRRVLRIASQLGYISVYWTLDSLDSVEPKKSPAFLYERITHHSDAELDGAIVLMHVGEPATAEALPKILRDLRNRRFEVVTISDLLNSKTHRIGRGGQ